MSFSGEDILTGSKFILSSSLPPWLAYILHRRIFEKENSYLGNEGFVVAVAGTTDSQPVQTFSQIYSIKLLYRNEPPGSWNNQWTNCPTSCLRLSCIPLSFWIPEHSKLDQVFKPLREITCLLSFHHSDIVKTNKQTNKQTKKSFTWSKTEQLFCLFAATGSWYLRVNLHLY